MSDNGNRLHIDQMFMMMAELMALRSTCARARVGAVIVANRRVISTGYVGSPPGDVHCIDAGCKLGPDGGCTRTIHAEANAIGFAARNGVKLDGATIYSTLAPCRPCAQMIMSAGLTHVVYRAAYRDQAALDVLKGIRVTLLDSPSHGHPYLGYESCLLCGVEHHAHS